MCIRLQYSIHVWYMHIFEKKKEKFSWFSKLMQRYKATRDVSFLKSKTTPAPSTASHKILRFSSQISLSLTPVFGITVCATALDLTTYNVKKQYRSRNVWLTKFDCIFWEISILKVRKIWSKNGVRKVWIYPSYLFSDFPNSVLLEEHFFNDESPVKSILRGIYHICQYKRPGRLIFRIIKIIFLAIKKHSKNPSKAVDFVYFPL